MREKTVKYYICEKCDAEYERPAQAIACEAKPITHDYGVTVDDVVVITSGQGKGKQAKVTKVFYIQPGWGPSIYDHSVALSADVIDSWGSRMLTFDSYQVLEDV